MVLAQLSNENSLQMCEKVFDIEKNTRSIIVKAIRKQLKPLVISKLIRDKIKKITIGFESLHGIPYILAAIYDNHIPIVAPKVDPKSYYCQKRAYSTLIQGIINAKCNFWDYGYGGERSRSMIGLFSKKCRKLYDEGQILTL